MEKGLRFTPNSYQDEDMAVFWNDFMSESKTVACQTSGSTGVPKTLHIPKQAMLYSAQNTVAYFGLNQHSVALLCLPAKYIAGRMMLVRAYVAGMTILSVQPGLNPLTDINEQTIHFSAFTPAQVIQIINNEHTKSVFAKIKHIIIGGAAIESDLERILLQFPNAIYATYGMTETVSHIALRKIGEAIYHKISNQTQLGTDSDNCLWIADENYTEQKLQTNDVVNLSANKNEFEWLGRRDFVINSGGIKLHPEQIEDKIRSLPAWQSVRLFIAKTTNPQFGERPILVIEAGQQTPPLDTLSEVLTSVEKPVYIKEVPPFIYTETGKLNRLTSLNYT